MSFILPLGYQQYPQSLTFVQFLQTVLSGVSGVPGALVRPNWQAKPPQQPDLDTNWIAFGVSGSSPDANSYVGADLGDATDLSILSQRNEDIEIACSIYGPDAYELYGILRDGLQLPQNLEALRCANMGLIEVGRAIHAPDLVNERWFNRYQTSIYFRKQTMRAYPVPTLVSANGTIEANNAGQGVYTLDWQTQN